MLERDYIMRLIQMFFEALAKFIRNKEGKDPEILHKEVDELYKTFLKLPRDHFYNMKFEEIVDSFDLTERVYKAEIVAELFYQDALLNDEINEMLLRKSLDLFKYADLNTETFSVDRHRKMTEIESILSSIS